MKYAFKSEISELKSLLVKPSIVSSVNVSNVGDNESKTVWANKQRTENLRHMMAIKKDEHGNSVDAGKLEKICIENGISVHKTFTLKRSLDTGIVLNSKSDAEKLKGKMTNDCPEHKIEKVATKVPTVNVVGFNREYSKEEILTMITNQNPSITHLLEESASPEDKILEVIYVAPLKKNNNIFRATIRVSNLIRSAISNQNDRLFVGSQTCKVYDRIFVLRCYNCQDFGHHSKDCKSGATCGFCSGKHETRTCPIKTNSGQSSCANCAKANHEDTNHEANSLYCPVYLEQLEKVKNTIPFYQGN